MPIWIAPKQAIEQFAGVDHRSGALHGDGCGLAPGPAASELVSAWIMYFMPQRREQRGGAFRAKTPRIPAVSAKSTQLYRYNDPER